MKSIKGGSLLRLVAFFVIAAILTCTVSFAAGGWQSFLDNEPDSDDAADSYTDGDVDENIDGSTENDSEAVIKPILKHYLTGIEITAAEAGCAPISFIYSASDPIYGISSAFLTVEIPTENGETRYLSLFSGGTYLGKIGSLSPTRGYINNISGALGAQLVYRGNDDSFSYSHSEPIGIDITQNSGYSYTEYSEYHYTNSDLVTAMIKNCGASQIQKSDVKAPFIHAESEIRGSETAMNIVIPYSESNTTQLAYHAIEGKYTLYKGSNAVKDLLNDRTVTYDNVFILFSDATTFETEDATETVFDTNGGGSGYYFTRGTAFKITWSADKDGNLSFYNDMGGLLSVNVGTSYIAFERSSRKNTVIYK